MERLAVPALDVYEVHQCLGDEVHRNDVGAARVRQRHGREPRQRRETRQHTEEVVRPVDLVHLAGAGIADHHRGSVDAVGHVGGRAHQHLGLELGLVIRRRQVLRDVEVVLGEHAAVVARDRDRGHVVQCGAESTRQSNHGPGPVDVGGPLRGLVDGDVVDRRAVHHVRDIPEVGHIGVGEAEILRGQVSDQGFRALTPVLGQTFEAVQRLAAHQDEHLGGGVTGEDLRHHPPTDKPGTAGNDIAHASHRGPRSSKRQPGICTARLRTLSTA